MKKPKLTVIYPIIRTDYISKSILTLKKFTTNVELRIIVVDQSMEGFWFDHRDAVGPDMVIRMQNQGFSKAANEGIIHALRWNSDYVCVCNDDTEFMYEGWFEDLIQEFDKDPRVLVVNPESPRQPLWGYGRPHDEHADILEHKEDWTPEDIQYLKDGHHQDLKERYPDLPGTFPLERTGVTDGFAMWCPVFRKDAFEKAGMFEERFIWGGGEDYDYMARLYSCAWPYQRDECDENFHWRGISTTRSWVWHWWGRSKDVKSELSPELFKHKQPWNNLNDLWLQAPNGQYVDPWGHWTDADGKKHPFKRDPEVRVEPL